MVPIAANAATGAAMNPPAINGVRIAVYVVVILNNPILLLIRVKPAPASI